MVSATHLAVARECHVITCRYLEPMYSVVSATPLPVAIALCVLLIRRGATLDIIFRLQVCPTTSQDMHSVPKYRDCICF